MDNCIDGDREKFDKLFGDMFDKFNAFFHLLRENDVGEIPKHIVFEDKADVSEFEVSGEISLEASQKTMNVFNCKIVIKPNQQTTKVLIK